MKRSAQELREFIHELAHQVDIFPNINWDRIFMDANASKPIVTDLSAPVELDDENFWKNLKQHEKDFIIGVIKAEYHAGIQTVLFFLKAKELLDETKIDRSFRDLDIEELFLHISDGANWEDL